MSYSLAFRNFYGHPFFPLKGYFNANVQNLSPKSLQGLTSIASSTPLLGPVIDRKAALQDIGKLDVSEYCACLCPVFLRRYSEKSHGNEASLCYKSGSIYYKWTLLVLHMAEQEERMWKSTRDIYLEGCIQNLIC